VNKEDVEIWGGEEEEEEEGTRGSTVWVFSGHFETPQRVFLRQCILSEPVMLCRASVYALDACLCI
jgi:hypothetical protein